MVTATDDKPTCYGKYAAGGEACNDCPTQTKIACKATSPAK